MAVECDVVMVWLGGGNAMGWPDSPGDVIPERSIELDRHASPVAFFFSVLM